MFFSSLKYLSGDIYMCYVDVCDCVLCMSVALWTSLDVGSCPSTVAFWCCPIDLTCSYFFACFNSSTLFPGPRVLSSIWSVLLVRISTEFFWQCWGFLKFLFFMSVSPIFMHVCVLDMPMYIHVCIVCKWARTCVSMWESSSTALGHFHWGIVPLKPSSHLRESG